MTLLQLVAVESPAFLAGARRERDARAAVGAIAAFNGVALRASADEAPAAGALLAAPTAAAAADGGAPASLPPASEPRAAQGGGGGAVEIFSSPRLLPKTLALGLLFLSVEGAYYALALSRCHRVETSGAPRWGAGA